MSTIGAVTLISSFGFIGGFQYKRLYRAADAGQLQELFTLTGERKLNLIILVICLKIQDYTAYNDWGVLILITAGCPTSAAR